jgi:hypothetical protein
MKIRRKIGEREKDEGKNRTRRGRRGTRWIRNGRRRVKDKEEDGKV